MPRRSDLIALRNNAICTKYKKLSSVVEHGVQKHNQDWILEELSVRHFFLDPATLWNIIMAEPDGGYLGDEPKKQLSIFPN